MHILQKKKHPARAAQNKRAAQRAWLAAPTETETSRPKQHHAGAPKVPYRSSATWSTRQLEKQRPDTSLEGVKGREAIQMLQATAGHPENLQVSQWCPKISAMVREQDCFLFFKCYFRNTTNTTSVKNVKVLIASENENPKKSISREFNTTQGHKNNASKAREDVRNQGGAAKFTRKA